MKQFYGRKMVFPLYLDICYNPSKSDWELRTRSGVVGSDLRLIVGTIESFGRLSPDCFGKVEFRPTSGK